MCSLFQFGQVLAERHEQDKADAAEYGADHGGCEREHGLHKFRRFATEVWGVSADGKTDEQIAGEGLAAMEGWMKQIGVATSIGELGATEEMLDGIANGTIILDGGYKTLTKADVIRVLKESL